jgi:hypothetical protein
VPQRYKTEDSYRLGQWVKVQRTNKKGLDQDRRQRLVAMPRSAIQTSPTTPCPASTVFTIVCKVFES